MDFVLLDKIEFNDRSRLKKLIWQKTTINIDLIAQKMRSVAKISKKAICTKNLLMVEWNYANEPDHSYDFDLKPIYQFRCNEKQKESIRK